MEKIYLDNNSTTQPDPQMVESLMDVIAGTYGNPSSLHLEGRKARDLTEKARGQVSESLHVRPSKIIFTSGGSEANSIILRSYFDLGFEIICSAVEHSSVLSFPHKGILPVSEEGHVDLNILEFLLKTAHSPKVLVSIMMANNETGIVTVPGADDLMSLKNKYGFILHRDAVQAYGKMDHNILADYLTISAHKVHGLKGAGAICMLTDKKLQPVAWGGSQEKGIRPGTENTPGIFSLGFVAERLAHTDNVKIASLRDALELKLEDIAEVNGRKEKRLSNTSSLSFKEVDDLDLFIEVLDAQGVMVSGKSACSSGMPAPSSVLTAMFGAGHPKLRSTIRVSLSKLTTPGEIDKAAERMRDGVEEYKRMKT